MASENETLTVANTIKTPLAFAALMVTTVEAVALGIAGALSGLEGSGEVFLSVFYVTIGFLVIMLIVVFAIAFFRPEALWGKRYFTSSEKQFAMGLGDDIFNSVDGYFGNGTDVEKKEAYDNLHECIKKSKYADTNARKSFCVALADSITDRVKYPRKIPARRGVIT